MRLQGFVILLSASRAMPDCWLLIESYNLAGLLWLRPGGTGFRASITTAAKNRRSSVIRLTQSLSGASVVPDAAISAVWLRFVPELEPAGIAADVEHSYPVSRRDIPWSRHKLFARPA